MTTKKIFISILLGTILSMLVFFSISFITFLSNLGPFHYYERDEWYHLEIGYPFTYYYEFFLSGSTTPNCGWNINYLWYDCLFTWIIVVGVYMLIKVRRAKKT